MTAQDRNTAPARTGGPVETDRLDLWREAIEARLNLTVSANLTHDHAADNTGSFFGRLETRQIGRCQIARMTTARAHYHLSDDNLGKADADLLLIQIDAGAIRVTQRDHRLTIAAEQGIILLGNEPLSIEVMEDATTIKLLCPPIADLAARIADLSITLMQRLDMTQAAGILLGAYISHLIALDPLPDDVTFTALVANHLPDLLANLLSEEANYVADDTRPRPHTIRINRKLAIKQRIADDIGDANLRPDDVAERVGISGRYLHKLLQEEGVMFSDLLRHQRLQQAYRLLTHPDHANSSIDTIAGEVGFSDLNYFKRRFRQYFYATPNAIRSNRQRRQGLSSKR